MLWREYLEKNTSKPQNQQKRPENQQRRPENQPTKSYETLTLGLLALDARFGYVGEEVEKLEDPMMELQMDCGNRVGRVPRVLFFLRSWWFFQGFCSFGWFFWSFGGLVVFWSFGGFAGFWRKSFEPSPAVISDLEDLVCGYGWFYYWKKWKKSRGERLIFKILWFVPSHCTYFFENHPYFGKDKVFFPVDSFFLDWLRTI